MKKLLFVTLLFCNRTLSQTKCDTAQLPIVFVHGFLASGDTWATQVQRFSTNGFCENRLFVFDWNTIGKSKYSDSLLDVFISDILHKSHSKQVNLVGHSAGTGLCFGYLKDSLHAIKVAHYVNIAGFKMKPVAGPSVNIPILNIYSTDDNVIRNGGDIAGADNLRETGMDHLQTATCEETFSNIFSFFVGGKRRVNPVIEPSKEIYISVGGKAVQLGENKPLTDSFIVYQFNPNTGKRFINKNNLPSGSITGWKNFAEDGSWGIELAKNSYTEFEVHPKSGSRLFYFFEPTVRNNKNRYIRALPETGMIANMLGTIPNDEKQTSLVIFSSNQAVIAGRDSLAIDDIGLSNSVLTPASKTAIAVFVFDDGDYKTSANALPGYKNAPFLSGADVFLKADANKTMRIYFNGRTMVLPRKKSKEGIMVAVFN